MRIHSGEQYGGRELKLIWCQSDGNFRIVVEGARSELSRLSVEDCRLGNFILFIKPRRHKFRFRLKY